VENFKEVELTTGKTKVYSPPMTKIEALMDRDPELKMPEPEVEELELPSGKRQVVIHDDDPVYLTKVAKVEELRDKKGTEMMWLFTLRDIKPPDGWNILADLGDEILYYAPDWEVREGKVGKKLDYIEWVVLADGANVKIVNAAINELAGISEEEVKQNEKSFPGEVEGEAA